VSQVAPAQLLLTLDPKFFDDLSDVERLVVPYLYDLWMRPEQRVPPGPWRYYGFHAGRGFGKTLGIVVEINRRVEAGEARSVGLMAPTLDRVDEVQHHNLIELAPPWFRPERYRGGLRWPNGVESIGFSPEAPGRPRSENLDLSWLTEIVDWQETTRLEAFNNITTATRDGEFPQVLWDTTSRGRNDVIEHLIELNTLDPDEYPIVWGSMLDNPMLSEVYLRGEAKKYPPGRTRDEEIHGKKFKSAAGASYKQEWIDAARADREPELASKLISIDPGLSLELTADPTGYVVLGLGALDGKAYTLVDKSKRVPAEEWGDWVVADCKAGAAGVLIETNHIGNTGHAVIKSRAQLARMEVRLLPRDEQFKPFPRRTPGVIYVKEIFQRDDKGVRSIGPASETEIGNARHVGKFAELELEQTTYVPGSTRRSPNRYDAYNAGVSELLGLNRPTVQDDREQTAAVVSAAVKLNEELRRVAAKRGIGL
jgi:phage terminase large subunit-like protein